MSISLLQERQAGTVKQTKQRAKKGKDSGGRESRSRYYSRQSKIGGNRDLSIFRFCPVNAQLFHRRLLDSWMRDSDLHAVLSFLRLSTIQERNGNHVINLSWENSS